jgi:two-component system, response regulator
MRATPTNEGPVKVMLVESREQDALWFRQAATGMPALEVVWHARDGEEAIHYLSGAGVFAERQTYPLPDVVVMDLDLPKLHGLGVLEWLWGRHQRPPVAIFSAIDNSEVRNSADRLGAHLFEQKSFEPVRFLRFLHWVEQMGLMERRSRSNGG